MKKLTLILFCFLFCVITAFSQIQREILGCQLGNTSYNTVCESLKAKNLSPYKKGTDIIYVRNVNFAGHLWDTASFEFHNNKLMSVNLMVSYIFSKDCIDRFNLLYTPLEKKYKELKVEENQGVISFEDEKSNLILWYSPTKNSVYILYNDKDLYAQKSEQQELEL